MSHEELLDAEALLALDFESAQQSVVSTFESVGDIFSQYSYLVAFSRDLPQMSDEQKAAAMTVDKCQSQVWLDLRVEDGRVFFDIDSDTLIVRSVLRLLQVLLNGRTCEEVAAAKISFLQQTGLDEVFEDFRMSGFAAILDTIKEGATR